MRICRYLFRKQKRKRPLGRPVRRWKDNMKIHLNETRYEF
jgi:hypothetical protein